MNTKKLTHNLSKEIHNIMQLLHFIDQDKELTNPENRLILHECLQREDSLMQTIKEISDCFSKYNK